MLGSENQPSAPLLELKTRSRCFQRHCMVPKAQRNRCRASEWSVSGASVQATASGANSMR